MSSLGQTQAPGKRGANAGARRIPLRLRGLNLRLRPRRMGKAEARMAAALEQLQSGIPLNWTQIEDDPELVTLARVYPVAEQARSQALEALPSDLHARVAERMSKRLPRPKAQPAKEAPRTLAGFSERVQVLTQVEDEIPRLRVLPWIAATTAASIVVALLAMWVGSFFGAPKGPFSWIEVRTGNGASASKVLAANLPSDYQQPNCPLWQRVPRFPYTLKTYSPYPDVSTAQNDLDFPIQYPPQTVSASTAYTLTEPQVWVAACDHPGSVPYSTLKLNYLVHWSDQAGQTKVTLLSFFEGRRQLALVDATQGTWKQVQVGNRAGILWHGPRYSDTSFVEWARDVVVLVVEQGDVTTTIIGRADQGATEQLVLAAAQGLAPQGTPTPISGQQPSTTIQPQARLTPGELIYPPVFQGPPASR